MFCLVSVCVVVSPDAKAENIKEEKPVKALVLEASLRARPFPVSTRLNNPEHSFHQPLATRFLERFACINSCTNSRAWGNSSSEFLIPIISFFLFNLGVDKLRFIETCTGSMCLFPAAFPAQCEGCKGGEHQGREVSEDWLSGGGLGDTVVLSSWWRLYFCIVSWLSQINRIFENRLPHFRRLVCKYIFLVPCVLWIIQCSTFFGSLETPQLVVL